MDTLHHCLVSQEASTPAGAAMEEDQEEVAEEQQQQDKNFICDGGILSVVRPRKYG